MSAQYQKGISRVPAIRFIPDIKTALVSQLISQVKTGENGSVIAGTTYNYSYDQNGNITQITDVSGVVQYRYQYDELGQLTREDNRPLNKTYVWTHDDAGNIQSKSTYAFTTGTLGAATSVVNYGYDDATWGDLLTYDGYYTIRYDEVGNPKHLLEYEEDDFLVGARLVWQGRQLTGYHLGEGYSGEIDEYYSSITFTYNADGIRIGKNVNGTQYEYIVSGSQILAEKWTYGGVEYFLQYLYDESGSPIGLNYRTSQYAENVFDVFYFEKNLQGDIVAIYNDSGVRIGTYTYDAWGNFTVSTTSGITATERNIVLNYNPFRYRGYYYDDDLGMYYLQSRYYNPQWGRFLNADDSAVITATPDALTDKNLYAYCDNNPITRIDEDGDFWNLVAQVVIGVATQYVGDVVGNIISGETGWDILKPTSSVGEYVAAGITALIPGSGLGGALARTVVEEVVTSAEDVLRGGEVNFAQSISDVAMGTLVDYGTGKIIEQVDGMIHKLEPKNYSSYAGRLRKKNPSITKNQIQHKMKNRIRSVRGLQEVSGFMIESISSSLF